MQFFSCAYGAAAGNPDTAHGAEILLELCTQEIASNAEVLHIPVPTNPGRQLNAIPDCEKINQGLSHLAEQAVHERKFFLNLGGDHSLAIGSNSGAARACDGPMGLLWIDAHLDSHTPDTSSSKNIHGMPLACLLGEGDQRLTNIAGIAANKPAIEPQNVCVIGARDYQNEEYDRLTRLGVKIIHSKDVLKNGINQYLEEIWKIVASDNKNFMLSFDVDALDPKYAPGVGTPAKYGLLPDDIISILLSAPQERWLGMDICEYNPIKDANQVTLNTLRKILATLSQKFHVS